MRKEINAYIPSTGSSKQKQETNEKTNSKKNHYVHFVTMMMMMIMVIGVQYNLDGNLNYTICTKGVTF